MFERFTDRAREVMSLATTEAARSNQEAVGTEHILLGLVDAGSSIGTLVLKNFGIDLGWIRPEVEKLAQAGPGSIADPTKLPQSPGAQKVIQFAREEARGLRHRYIDTEHLLLGLLREEDGLAGRALRNFGLSTEKARQGVIDIEGIGIDPVDQPDLPPSARSANLETAREKLASIQLFANYFHRLAAAEIPGPTQPAASIAPPPAPTAMPNRFAEAWVRIAVGAILFCMMPSMSQYLLSFANLAPSPTAMRDGTPYAQSSMVLPDAGIAAYAGVLIVGGLIFLLPPRRPWLNLLAGLTLAAVVVNMDAVAIEWSRGFLFVNALAVAFGGYQFIDLLGVLRGNRSGRP